MNFVGGSRLARETTRLMLELFEGKEDGREERESRLVWKRIRRRFSKDGTRRIRSTRIGTARIVNDGASNGKKVDVEVSKCTIFLFLPFPPGRAPCPSIESDPSYALH